MPPRVVLHKRNGHRHVPPMSGGALADALRLVHSTPPEEPPTSFEVLQFGCAIRREDVVGLVEQATLRIDALEIGLVDALARTDARLNAGDLGDIGAQLAAWRRQAEAAGRILSQLRAALEAGARGGIVLDANRLVRRAVAAAQPRLPADTRLTVRFDGDRLRVVGHGGHLARALASFLVYAGEKSRIDAARGSVVVETSSRPGAVEGEPIVGVTIRAVTAAGGPPALPGRAESADAPSDARDAELWLACRTIAAHGGVVQAADDGDGFRISIELPAA